MPAARPARLPARATVRLDARADRLDIRDRWFTPAVLHLPPQCPDDAWFAERLPVYVKAGMVLDQGSDGACTGFGLAAVINYLYWQRDAEHRQVSPRMIYHLAQFYDEWPGEDYSGSSCRGALKGWHKHGVCRRSLWPYTVRKDGSVPAFEAPHAGWAEDALQHTLGVYYRIEKSDITAMQAAIAQTGAIYVSATIHAGWNQVRNLKQPFTTLSQLPRIPAHSLHTGGHAFALTGYTEDGFVVQNSWGINWGQQGFAVLGYDDWLSHGSDVWTVAMGVPAQASVSLAVSSKQPAAARSAIPIDAGLPALPAYRYTPAARTMQRGQHALSPLTTDQAYNLSVIMDSGTRGIQRLVAFASAADSITHVVQAAQDWHRTQGLRSRLQLAIYAMSGLAGEEQQAQQIAALAPWFLANQIYPIFLNWSNGMETLPERLQQMSGDSIPAHLSAQEQAALDRRTEAGADAAGLRASWTQCRHQAQQATAADDPPRALHVLIRALQTLSRSASPASRPQLHLIGHSAGALLCGQLLEGLRDMPVVSCSLIAPACNTEDAGRYFGEAMRRGQLRPAQLHIDVLDAQREQQDAFSGTYRHSLLTLISNALEDRCQTPLIGLADSFFAADQEHRDHSRNRWNPACLPALKQWQQQFWGKNIPIAAAAGSRANTGLTAAQQQRLHLISRRTLRTVSGEQPVSHAALALDLDLLGALLQRLRGRKALLARP
ncbi:C1 family peptidase [Undibacterium oligocarboniphilum]|uniref:C1 family peptidase n=1 Tax=Undibacterium oligocarboniphilum TaxID=666702 RepID=A0A850QN60_9BURK|nr:C1 family peptidase [Undibacterium oligocarboniphilum]MBC3869445.1 C1 family peptidase [Undibacterium oligocarboniphilum]NVO77824.1 C1 family peptidase [Undibacterium oligocarboniphilum]